MRISRDDPGFANLSFSCVCVCVSLYLLHIEYQSIQSTRGLVGVGGATIGS